MFTFNLKKVGKYVKHKGGPVFFLKAGKGPRSDFFKVGSGSTPPGSATLHVNLMAGAGAGTKEITFEGNDLIKRRWLALVTQKCSN